MTKEEKKYYIEKRLCGYWSALNGLELKEILYGINDYAIVVEGAWRGNRKVHKSLIRYGKRPFISLNGSKYYFDECVRES